MSNKEHLLISENAIKSRQEKSSTFHGRSNEKSCIKEADEKEESKSA